MGIEKRSLTPLKDIVADLFGDGGLPINTDDVKIWDVWDDVVGTDISINAKPLWIKKGLLRVTVSDPIWLQELKFSEKTIKEDLNRKLGRKAVRKLDLRVGPVHNY
ncbi:MAG TPA: DUF721 domain-containing protein [Desulfobacteraceae bacterium]|jgi:hypothetical protein|nr:DUF721 domain-containing protein [Desulfobacteraceae bacterium]HPJ66583.1 DUF721 domain-containing protein [Desulfobacteraceae bacterium]HPQ28805.1 DUF721 domain-containing protein [Desulfobacteraceae bacterium]